MTTDEVQAEDFLQFMSFMGVYLRAVEHKRQDRIVSDVFAEPLTRQIAPQLAPRMEKWTQRLDTRPYRLESLYGCHVFELDQNIALFEHKVNVLEELSAKLLPEQHEIVVADVNDFNWEEKLLSAGFDSNVPTFWALDGVTMYLERESNVALLKTIDILSAPGSEIWGDVGGEALKAGEIVVFKQVDELSQAELGTNLFKLGEDDAIHGVFSELPWELTLQAELKESGMHFGREWEPVLSGKTKKPVPLSFVHGVKTS